MSSTNRTLSWWAHSSTRARLTLAGAALIIIALVTTSVVVWNSPSNPIVKAVAAVSKEDIAQQKVLHERNALLSQVVALQKQLAAKQSNLTTTKSQLASIQQQLWSAQGQLEAANAAAAAKPSKTTPVKKPTKPSPTAASISAPSKAEIVAPNSRYFGMYTEQAPFNWATYDNTATKIGLTPNVVGYFGGWDENFRANAVQRAWQRNSLPILTWEGRPIADANDVVDAPDYSLPRVIGDPAAGVPGAFDDYLRQYARDIVANGLPLGIRLNHEMNGTWYPWAEDDGNGKSINGNRPGDYVKTWQHVHDIFQEEGANDLVIWIWAPNIINRLPDSHKTPAYLASLYPGDGYVDWVGLSAYLRPPFRTNVTYNASYTLDDSVKQLRSLAKKPIFLAEIGASEIGGYKPAWITSLFQKLADPANSDIIGFSWFNLSITTYVQGELATNDWRIDSRGDSIDAFKAGLTLPGSNFSLVPK